MAYRIKGLTRDNLADSQREVYSVLIGATGAVGTVRSSAGSTAAAGAGNMVTVTRVGTGIYRFALAQTYFKMVGATATLSSPYDVTGAAVAPQFCQASVYNAATNSFLVYICDTSDALADPASGSQIVFEMYAINAVSPTSL